MTSFGAQALDPIIACLPQYLIRETISDLMKRHSVIAYVLTGRRSLYTCPRDSLLEIAPRERIGTVGVAFCLPGAVHPRTNQRIERRYAAFQDRAQVGNSAFSCDFLHFLIWL